MPSANANNVALEFNTPRAEIKYLTTGFHIMGKSTHYAMPYVTIAPTTIGVGNDPGEDWFDDTGSQFINQRTQVIRYFRFKVAPEPRPLTEYSFSLGEFKNAPTYSLFQKVPEGFSRLVFTTEIPANVDEEFAVSALPTVGSLTPDLPPLEDNQVVMFDLVTPQNRQTVLRVGYSPVYKAFYAAFNDRDFYSVYNTHDAASLFIANCAVYSIGTLPSTSPLSTFLSRVTTGEATDSIIMKKRAGPYIQTLPRKFLQKCQPY